MLEIKFEAAPVEAARHVWHERGGIAGEFFADYYATTANRQLAEYVAKCSAMTDEELAQELRVTATTKGATFDDVARAALKGEPK